MAHVCSRNLAVSKDDSLLLDIHFLQATRGSLYSLSKSSMLATAATDLHVRFRQGADVFMQLSLT